MRVLLSALLLSTPALAQDPLTFTIDQDDSNWHWDGTTSLGPLEGNPSQDFQLAGALDLLVDSGAIPIATGRFVPGSEALVTPDLSGKIPNPIPPLPPLAVIDITGVKLQFTSPAFAIDAAGNFTTMVTVTILEGTLTVTPLVGSVTHTDLAGTSGDPTLANGNLSQTGMDLRLESPQSGTFDFTDPGSGISATVNLTGSLEADYGCEASFSYCSANPNSTGLPALIDSSGSTRLQDNAFTLLVGQLPQNRFGYFFTADSEDFVPNFGGTQGNLCVGTPLVRFSQNVLNSGSSGQVSFQLDLLNLPQGTVFHPGERWNFQLWYRDMNPGSTSNTTDGRAVVWCP